MKYLNSGTEWSGWLRYSLDVRIFPSADQGKTKQVAK